MTEFFWGEQTSWVENLFALDDNNRLPSMKIIHNLGISELVVKHRAFSGYHLASIHFM
ncbi:hypothetical protein FOA43_001013 [Brettanomyces nanus]|uniref:Uncharacterized protein n=1 Tax=Eeniella nana TaxID=13502 RepID=A0A875RNH4_EENNA|nr:uncharacterized protein FOA43_001013 [Brettanomyces nanus]QPG73700.1 hypothetical protein FOA43_001013 [Brettanomyces nanus]